MNTTITSENRQTVTSAKTSIKQIPALVKSTLFDKLVNSAFTNSSAEPSILNFGAGKYPELTADFLREKFPGVTVSSYDPYNLDKKTNEASMDNVYDLVVCANVLNVIHSDAALYAAVVNMASHTCVYGRIVIGVYEGDKSGVGKLTQNGESYQRNLPVSAYLPIIRDALTYQSFGVFYVEKCGRYVVLTRKA